MGQSEKQKEWKKEHYNNNKEYYREKQQKRRQEIRILVEGLKIPCIVCGESDIACIDFHHVDPNEKELKIGDAGNHKWSDIKIIDEINKCVCLCANHHRILHYHELSVEELIQRYKK